MWPLHVKWQLAFSESLQDTRNLPILLVKCWSSKTLFAQSCTPVSTRDGIQAQVGLPDFNEYRKSRSSSSLWGKLRKDWERGQTWPKPAGLKGRKMCTSDTFPSCCEQSHQRFCFCVPIIPICVQLFKKKEDWSIRDFALMLVSDFVEWFSRILAKHIKLIQVSPASAEFLSSQDKERPLVASLGSRPAWLYFLLGWLELSKMNTMTASNTERGKVKIKWQIGLFHHPEAWHPILEQNEEHQTDEQMVHKTDNNALHHSPRESQE